MIQPVLSNSSERSLGPSSAGTATKIQAPVAIGQRSVEGDTHNLFYYKVQGAEPGYPLSRLEGQPLLTDKQTVVLSFPDDAEIMYDGEILKPHLAIAKTTTNDILNSYAPVGCSVRFYSKENTRGHPSYRWRDIPDATIQMRDYSVHYPRANAKLFVKDPAEESLFDRVQNIPVKVKTCSETLFVESLASGDAQICRIAADDYDHWVASHAHTSEWGTVRGKVTMFTGGDSSKVRTADG